MSTALRHQLITLVSDLFRVELDPSRDDVRRDEVEAWDSVNHFRLVVGLEESYGISLEDQEILELDSVGDTETLLRGRGVGDSVGEPGR